MTKMKKKVVNFRVLLSPKHIFRRIKSPIKPLKVIPNSITNMTKYKNRKLKNLESRLSKVPKIEHQNRPKNSKFLKTNT